MRLIKYFSLLMGLFLSAQEYNFGYNTLNYNINNGFPSSEVYYGMKDSKDFIWFCTDKGLARYNGIEFNNFTVDNNLADNTLYGIFEDEGGNLWFNGSNSITIYDQKLNKFQPYKYNDKIRKLQLNSKIEAIFKSKKNDVYLILQNKGFVEIKDNGTVNSYNIPVYYCKNNGFFIYVNSGYKIIYWKGKKLYTGEFFRAKLVMNKEFYYGNSHYVYIKDDDKSVDIIDLKNFHSYSYKCPYTINSVSFNTNTNTLYFSTKNGVIKYYITDKSSVNYLSNYEINYTLDGNNTGLYLLSSYNGLYIIPNNSVLTLNNYGQNYKRPVSYLFNSKEALYINFENDNTILQYSNYEFKNINPDVNLSLLYEIQPFTSSEAITFNSNGYTTENGQDKGYIRVNSFGKNGEVLYILDRDNGIYKVENKVIKKLNALNKILFKVMTLTSFQGKLWIGTETGWYMYDEDLNRLKYIETKKNYSIKVMQNYKDKYLLMGTKNNGILAFDGNKYVQFNVNSGLLSNIINDVKIQEDKVWVASSRGIVSLSINFPKLKVTDSFSISNGLNSTDINSLAIYNNEIYAGSKYGLNFIKPYIKPRKNLNIYVDNVKVNNKELNDYNNISIPNNSSLEVKLILTSYNTNSPSIYYRIKEINSDFKKTNNLNINYESIHYGDYTLEYYAQDFIEKTPVKSLKVVVNPPLLAKWYVLIPLILLLGYLSYYLIKLYFQRIEDKYKNQQEINRYKLLAFNKQMSSHFISNSFNAINNFILKNDNVGGSKYLSRMSKLFRHSLQATEKSYIPFIQELEAIRSYIDLEKLRYNNSFEYSIELDESLPLSKISVMPLILQTLIENAIWHGLLQSKRKDKKLFIDVAKSKYPNLLKVTIVDNGIGVDKEALKKEDSKGIHLVKSILETNSFTKVVNSENIIKFVHLDEDLEDKGTICTVLVPIIYEI